jgi:hypothetical protein
VVEGFVPDEVYGLGLDGLAVSNFLELAASKGAGTRLFFGDTSLKTACVELCRFYRARKGVFCSSGILLGDEASGTATVWQQSYDRLDMGDPAAMVELGCAPDFGEAVWLILQVYQAGEFVVASGDGYPTEWRRFEAETEAIHWFIPEALQRAAGTELEHGM